MTSKSNLLPLPDRLDQLWPRLQQEALDIETREPVLASHVHAVIVSRESFVDALGHLLAEELAGASHDVLQIRETIAESHTGDPSLVTAAQNDLAAIVERDPAARSLIVPFLFFKGFHALQSYRVAHWLWRKDRQILAFYLQSLIAKHFVVDIHPAAKIGQGVMMDHAHGIVIGETSVVEDNVSFLHGVTLGAAGKERGDRHPKIRAGAMIGAGAKILGNIEVGAGARVAAGSVVMHSVPPRVTVAGVPARVIGGADGDDLAGLMDQMLLGAGI